MNKLSGQIVGIESSQHMSLVDVSVSGHMLSAVILETPATSHYLKVGEVVTLLFKETEVSLAKNLKGEISLRNRLSAVVEAVERSTILSKVILNFKDTTIVSIISTRSVDKMQIKRGDAVEWLVKTNEISILSS